MKQLSKHVLLILCAVSITWLPGNAYGQEMNNSQVEGGHGVIRQAHLVGNSPAVSANTNRAMAGPANDLFANATTLTVGAGLTIGTNYQGSLETGENTDCNSTTAVSSVWYVFSAGANTTLYVNLYDFGLGAYFTGVAVWNTTTLPTGVCQALQCQDNEQVGIADYSLELTNLTNQKYYIQVTYPSTTDNNNNFELSVTTAALYPVSNPPPVSTCASPVAGCFVNSYNPSAATVEAACPGYQFLNPPYPAGTPYTKGSLQDGYVYSICYSFTNLNTSGQINIQNILFTCATNTLWLDWTIYNASCAPVGCGNLTGNTMTVSGVACNTQYEICETFEAECGFYNNITASNGTKKGIIPYASWPSGTPVTCSALPIQLENFSVDYEQANNSVYVGWTTATETNNKVFNVEKSVDGANWYIVATQQGSGNSSTPRTYDASDENPYPGVSYYRLKQTDFDGNFTYSSIVPLDIPAAAMVRIFPNPTSGNMTLKYTSQSPDPIIVKISDLSGKVVSNYLIDQVMQGENNFEVNTATLHPGMYFMQVSNPQKTFYLKFVKE